MTKDDFLLALDESCVVLCGAGVSIAPPTALDGAVGFFDSLKNALVTSSSVAAGRILTGLNGSVSHPPLRFEELITILMDVDPGLKSLDYLLVDGLDAPMPQPNALHSWIAKGLANGCHVITTNFDVLIEISLFKFGPKAFETGIGNLEKVHGSIQQIRNWELVSEDRSSLKADIRSVAMRTSVDFVPGAVEHLLGTIDGRKLIVVGYSFSDSFDIVPLLARASPKNATVIEYAANKLRPTDEFQSLRDYEIVERAWRQNRVDFQKLSGDLTLHLPSIPESKATVSVDVDRKPRFPELLSFQSDYVVARLEMDRGLYTETDLFRRVAERAETHGDLLLAEQAAFYEVWSLPEWDVTLEAAYKLFRGAEIGTQTLRALILLLDGASMTNNAKLFVEYLGEFRCAMCTLEGSIDESDHRLYLAKVYHCVANLLIYRGKFRWAAAFLEASQSGRQKFGNPDEVSNATVGLCLAHIFAGTSIAAKSSLIDLRRYARQAMDGRIRFNLCYVEGAYLLQFGAADRARERLERARMIMNQGEEVEQYDPELELFILAARMRSEDNLLRSADFNCVRDYALAHNFEFLVEPVEALKSYWREPATVSRLIGGYSKMVLGLAGDQKAIEPVD